MIDKSQFIATFIAEVEGYLTTLNKGFVTLESNPKNFSLLEELFRAAHTLKGAARMMGFNQIRDVAHKLEDLFEYLNKGKVVFNPSVADPVFKALDIIKQGLENIGSTQKENIDVASICQEIEQVSTQSSLTSQTATRDIKDPIKDHQSLQSKKEKINQEVKERSRRALQDNYIRVPIERINDLLNLMGEIVINKVKSSHKVGMLKKLSKQSFSAERMLFELDSMIKDALSIPDEIIQNKGKILRASQELEKAVHVLNHLHVIEAMFGDLRCQFQQLSDNFQTENFYLSPLIEEIQQKMKEMRMLPCSTIFEVFPRLVRDIAREQNKEIQLVIKGAHTELDKKVLDEIKGPLIHILRNAVDHGIEEKKKRLELGKNEIGAITLEAFQEGGRVIIQVTDDGQGVDVKQVVKKALEKGLVDQTDLDKMTEQEIVNLVFAPGFSTSPIITDVSGRGIGLDVVRTEIERLKGKVEIITQYEQGTTIRVELPLTIAIMRVLMITSASIRWAFPMTNLEESLTIHRKDIDTISNQEVIQVRGRTIPIVPLNDLLGVKSSLSEDEENQRKSLQKTEDDEITVVITKSLNKKVGFIVDKILGEEEVFIKSIGPHLGKIRGVSGSTILPSGDVVVILDAQDLIVQAQLAHPAVQARQKLTVKRKKKILVVEDSLTTRELEKTILENSGYQVEMAIDGLDALNKLAVSSFDVVVSDIQMPRMDGFELCKSIKKNENMKNIPVIFVTALSKEEEKRKGIEVGAQAYILKSQFDQGNLLDTIARLS